MSIVPQESCLKKKRKEEVTGHGAYTELNKTCSDKNKGMIKEERKKKKHQGGQGTENPAFVAPIQVKNKFTKDKLLKEL